MKNELATFSLSVEELALCFSMINLPSLGQEFLRSVGSKLDPQQTEQRLIAAGHSLVAHELAKINPGGTTVLDAGIELALLPIARPDLVIQTIRTANKEHELQSIYYNSSRKLFTAQQVTGGVIHHFTHGGIDQLPKYLTGIFDGFGSGDPLEYKGESIDSEILGAIGANIQNEVKIQDLLNSSKLSPSLKDKLAKDILSNHLRGTIVFMEKNQENKSTRVSSCMLLSGDENHWLFRYDQEPNSNGIRIFKAGKDSLQKAIDEIIDKLIK